LEAPCVWSVLNNFLFIITKPHLTQLLAGIVAFEEGGVLKARTKAIETVGASPAGWILKESYNNDCIGTRTGSLTPGINAQTVTHRASGNCPRGTTYAGRNRPTSYKEGKGIGVKVDIDGEGNSTIIQFKAGCPLNGCGLYNRRLQRSFSTFYWVS
jgi:hypothetical protein